MAGLYVHIPYCHSKCYYCDFYSSARLHRPDEMVDALLREIDIRRHEIKEPFTTIYIGGGTPSILPKAGMLKLGQGLSARAGDVSEFTVEVNPEDVSHELVDTLVTVGVNRVSMGVQSLVDTELKAIGRRHDAEAALRAVDAIRAGGIDNISLDLIYGLPGQTLESWRYSLEGVLDMAPRHLSAYILSYEPGTRLTAMLRRGKVMEADEDTVAQMYAMLTAAARRRGYLHYEISNFALPGFEAVHNSRYWDGTPYLGVGPSAHSFDGDVRRVNPADTKAYLEALGAGIPAFTIDPEDDANKFNDLVITALRTSSGLLLSKVKRRRRHQLLCDVYPYLKSGKVAFDSERLWIPEEHWLVSDAILTDLMQ